MPNVKMQNYLKSQSLPPIASR